MKETTFLESQISLLFGMLEFNVISTDLPTWPIITYVIDAEEMTALPFHPSGIACVGKKAVVGVKMVEPA